MMRDDLHELRHGIVGAWSPAAAQYRTGATGHLLEDLSGRGNHGTLTSMEQTDWTTRQGYGALTLDASGEYFTTPFPALSAGSPASLSLWLYPNTWTGGFTALGDSAVRRASLFFDTNGDLSFAGGIWGDISATQSTGMINGSLWHLFVTRPDNTTVYFFVNGIKKATWTGTIVTSMIATSIEWGSNPSGGGTNYQGDILEVCLYHSHAFIAPQLYALGPGGLFTPRRRRIVAPVTAAAGNRRRRMLLGIGA